MKLTINQNSPRKVPVLLTAFLMGFIYNTTLAELGRNRPQKAEFKGFSSEFWPFTKPPRKFLDLGGQSAHKFEWPKPQPFKTWLKQPARSMSQIIGIICKEGIVIACESQITVGSRKLFNGAKLNVIKFKYTSAVPSAVFGSALIAQAGSVTESSKAINYIQDMAKDRDITTIYALSEIVEIAINKIRREILESLQERPYSIEEQNQIFNDSSYYFELVLAHYYCKSPTPSHARVKWQPCLFKASLANSRPEPQSSFAVSGAAGDLAFFILKQFPCEQMTWGEAACLAVDTLDRINNADIYCGGQIILGTALPLAHKESTGAIYGNDLVEKILVETRNSRTQNESKYRADMGDAMKKIHKKLTDEFDKEVESRRKTIENTGENK